MRFFSVFVAAVFASTTLSQAADRPKQLLLISFDGAGNNALWQRSRDVAQRTGAHFTYFLSCTLVIDRDRAKTYQGPRQKAGRSNVGFAQTKDEAVTRLDHIWQAHQEGHEIASHTCGHFDGKDWSVADWRQEMQAFRTVLTSAWSDLGAVDREPAEWRGFVQSIQGFRAPYLSTSDALNEAERREGFTYDASGITKGPSLPQASKGILNFGLPLIPEGPENRRIIAMDYNLFIRHSAGVENPSRTTEFEERSYAAFRAAFDREYKGDRIPLQLGFHFVEMNGGAYWRAMERLVTEVCHMPDVACVTYAEAIDMLNGREASEHRSGL
ncbi:polysaccharide deacetylase family protein [Rhizobium sp. SL86]|uniref:polysaccharide deacetylase family protein n=1 Tax=Rhizobium sp. SL86 TaxID=2995148 RepID=UPI0022748E08|nr:polysaccharide deacetylase family protein [Rhizobium sp. SL86]MCY1668117.1 polysaccharide deacetylase family protein [Rhizobium sp. SL86]